MARSRIRNQLLAVLMAGALVATAAACGSSSKKEDQASGNLTSGQSDESTTTTKAKSSGTTTDLGAAANEMQDALNNLGNGQLGDCLTLSMAYAGVMLTSGFAGLGAAFGGNNADMQQAIDEMKKAEEQVPAEIRDDFEVIRKATESMMSSLQGTSGNIMDPEFQKKMDEAGKALDTPQVKQAQDNIEQYIQKTCPDFAGSSSGSSSSS